MLGADIGTTLAAQVLSFDLGWVSPLLIGAGVITFLSSEQDKARHLGRVAIGLGLMLLSLKLLALATAAAAQRTRLHGDAAGPAGRVRDRRRGRHARHLVRAFQPVDRASGHVASPAAGLIEPELALALVIGANIGGALAPYMAQSGADVAARRVPLANLMTRAIVGVALLPFLGQAVDWLSLVDASATRLPVNFHTAFNVAGLAGLPAAGRRRRLGLPPPAARQAGRRRSRQAAASRSQRARFAGRGAGLRRCARR